MTPDVHLDLYLDGRFVGTVRPDPALFAAPPAAQPAAPAAGPTRQTWVPVPSDGRCRLSVHLLTAPAADLDPAPPGPSMSVTTHVLHAAGGQEYFSTRSITVYDTDGRVVPVIAPPGRVNPTDIDASGKPDDSSDDPPGEPHIVG